MNMNPFWLSIIVLSFQGIAFLVTDDDDDTTEIYTLTTSDPDSVAPLTTSDPHSVASLTTSDQHSVAPLTTSDHHSVASLTVIPEVRLPMHLVFPQDALTTSEGTVYLNLNKAFSNVRIEPATTSEVLPTAVIVSTTVSTETSVSSSYVPPPSSSTSSSSSSSSISELTILHSESETTTSSVGSSEAIPYSSESSVAIPYSSESSEDIPYSSESPDAIPTSAESSDATPTSVESSTEVPSSPETDITSAEGDESKSPIILGSVVTVTQTIAVYDGPSKEAHLASIIGCIIMACILVVSLTITGVLVHKNLKANRKDGAYDFFAEMNTFFG